MPEQQRRVRIKLGGLTDADALSLDPEDVHDLAQDLPLLLERIQHRNVIDVLVFPYRSMGGISGRIAFYNLYGREQVETALILKEGYTAYVEVHEGKRSLHFINLEDKVTGVGE